MLNDPRSHGLWEKTAPPAPDAVKLEGIHTADVVIVGGGYTGLSTALHLAEAGVSVILLEAKHIGFGGAGRNVGLLNAGLWVMPDDIGRKLSSPHGERLLTLLGDGPRTVADLIQRCGIACELTNAGTLHCAVGDKGLAEINARAAQWLRRGAPVQLLSAAETATRTGTGAYAGALLDLRAGTLQPLAYVRGLARAASDAGARLHAMSPVLASESRRAAWTVATPLGKVHADWVVAAGDAYSFGPWEAVRAEQTRLPYFNFATAPLSDQQRRTILPGLEGCWDTKTILSSFRLDAAGRLIFGSVGALRGSARAVHRAWARRSLKGIFPALGKVDFEHEWYGHIGMTCDALPRFHRFADRVIGVSGYNGRGIAPGTVFGKMLADHIRGAVTEADLPLPATMVQPVPWRSAREKYYEVGAQLAHFAGSRF